MRRHPVVGFYILAFGISWIGLVPGVLASRGISPFGDPYVMLLFGILFSAGPTIAAVIVSLVIQGKSGLQKLLKGLIRWRVSLVWYVVAVFGPVCIFSLGQAITTALGLSLAPPESLQSQMPLFISVFLTFLVNTGEEIGWRGVALPLLQKRYNALHASLIVGFLWSLWHLPLVFLTGNLMAQSPLFWLISIVASAFIYTWLFNSTGGSILLVALLHVSGNVTGAIIPGVSPGVYALLNCVAAIMLIAVFGSTNLSRRERVSSG
jgi:membrane protease YdiL (CAAX protease family)